MITDRIDLRPLRHPKAMLARIGALRSPTASWVKVGRFTGRVVDADHDIVCKHLADAYYLKLARRHKVDRTYSRRCGRAGWFRERQGRGRG